MYYKVKHINEYRYCYLFDYMDIYNSKFKMKYFFIDNRTNKPDTYSGNELFDNIEELIPWWHTKFNTTTKFLIFK